MTLEAWVNPSTVSSAWRDVIYKGNDNYYLEGTSTTSSRPAGGGTFGGGNANVFGTAALTANTWSFLALTYDGSNLRLYVNGTLVNTQAKTGAIASSTNQLQIGGDSIYGQYFRGLIDEVRVYNLALSAAAIQTDMATPIARLRRHAAAVGARDAHRLRERGRARSTSPGAPPPTTSASPATRSGAARAPAARTSRRSPSRRAPARRYQDTGLAAGTSYSYEVRAVDAAGNPVRSPTSSPRRPRRATRSRRRRRGC